jgi:integrase
MSVRRIGNRWQVRVRLGSGRRVEPTLPPGATRADARALEAQIRRASIDAAAGKPRQYLIDEALDRWVETAAKALRSWRLDLQYRVDILRQYTAGKPLEALPDVADAIKKAGRDSGLKPPSINRYVALLRRVGNLAERWGWTDLPLGRRVVLLPENSHRHVYLTPAEVEALAVAADPLTGDMIRFAALTGLRQGELLALRPEQLRDGLLLLDTATKSGRPRAIPLPAQADAIGRRRLPWGMDKSRLRDAWVKARAAAKRPDVRWHDLRHTYASWLVQDGQALTAVRDLLGHSSTAVTNRYAHLAPAHLRGAVASLPQLGGERVGKKKRRQGVAGRSANS